MSIYIKSKDEVDEFLQNVNEIASEINNVYVNNQPWAGGRVNKTRLYMDETGLDVSDMVKVIQELGVQNYSSTKDDRNQNFQGELV